VRAEHGGADREPVGQSKRRRELGIGEDPARARLGRWAALGAGAGDVVAGRDRVAVRVEAREARRLEHQVRAEMDPVREKAHRRRVHVGGHRIVRERDPRAATADLLGARVRHVEAVRCPRLAGETEQGGSEG